MFSELAVPYCTHSSSSSCANNYSTGPTPFHNSLPCFDGDVSSLVGFFVPRFFALGLFALVGLLSFSHSGGFCPLRHAGQRTAGSARKGWGAKQWLTELSTREMFHSFCLVFRFGPSLGLHRQPERMRDNGQRRR